MINSKSSLRKKKKDEFDDKYLFISKDEINEELKRDIIKIESLGKELSKIFKKNIRRNLKDKENQI